MADISNSETSSVAAQDSRITSAIAHVTSLLVPGERIEAYAAQHRFFAMKHRRSMVFATSGRFIGLSRNLISGFTLQDVRWQDVKDVRIQVGVLSADLTIEALSSTDLAISGSSSTLTFEGLSKEEAKAVYRLCQMHEQSWREKRRIRELEELRAKSGGINLGGVAMGTPVQASGENGDAMTRLQQAKEMFEKGLISDSEYESIKARILSSM